MIERYAQIARALNEAEVRYVVVGGWAVLIHGHARMTVDLDLAIDLAPDNASAAVRVLTEAGLVPVAPVDASQFADPAARQRWIDDKNMIVLAFRDPGDPLIRVDLFVESPLPMDSLVSQAIGAEIHGVPVKVASIDHLIEMKRISGRPQDLADIEALEDLR
jgi:hypothetical protein